MHFSFQKKSAPARVKLQSLDRPDALTQRLFASTSPPANTPDPDQPHFLNGIFAWRTWERLEKRQTAGGSNLSM